MEGPSERKIKTICVFCGSHFGKGQVYLKEAIKLGMVLAARKINLVYGGGSYGLKGCVSTAASKRGSKVLGIIPSILAASKVNGITVGSELRVDSMHAKMGNMLHNADAFIALPGGLETLEETFSIASWSELTFHQKPLGLLNVNGFYDGLLFFLDHAVEQEFMTQATRRILISASTADQLIDKLISYVPEPDPMKAMAIWSATNAKREREEEVESKSDMDLSLRL